MYQSDEQYPPTTNKCPDNWIVDGSFCTLPSLDFNNPLSCPNCGKNNFVVNDPNNNTYKTFNGAQVYDNNEINQFEFKLLSSPCQLKKWAEINNIQWDGIRNKNKC